MYVVNELLGMVAPQTDETAMMHMLQKIVRMLETQGFTEEKDMVDHINDVVRVNPGMFGISFDVNAAVKKWYQQK